MSLLNTIVRKPLELGEHKFIITGFKEYSDDKGQRIAIDTVVVSANNRPYQWYIFPNQIGYYGSHFARILGEEELPLGEALNTLKETKLEFPVWLSDYIKPDGSKNRNIGMTPPPKQQPSRQVTAEEIQV